MLFCYNVAEMLSRGRGRLKESGIINGTDVCIPFLLLNFSSRWSMESVSLPDERDGCNSIFRKALLAFSGQTDG